MPTDNPPIRLTLLQFLKQARHLHAQNLAGALSASTSPIYVLGNPSADLDSIISAIIYSYFASGYIPSSSSSSSHSKGRLHIPLINLPDVPSGSELWRLRPEFVTALWLSTNNPSVAESERWDNQNAQSAGKFLGDHILTVADLKAQFLTGRRDDRCAHLKERARERWSLDTTMVDWNAFLIRSTDEKGKNKGLLEALPDVEFRVVGCIDHHVDEGFVSSSDAVLDGRHPLVIQPGPGSCTSLVVRELRSRGLWLTGNCGSSSSSSSNTGSATTSTSAPSPSTLISEIQAAKLALAAILIDTTNLTAKGKVTDVDRLAVSFLETEIQHSQQSWNRSAFFQTILKTKQNSLDLLTLPEILDRDYKDWTEKTSSSSSSFRTKGKEEEEGKKRVKLGFCSSVKPIEWIINKAGNPQAFLDALREFSSQRNLDIIVVMTAFNDDADNNKFRRELLLCALHPGMGEEGSKHFASRAESELGLSSWSSSIHHHHHASDNDQKKKTREIVSILNTDSPIWCRIWEQRDVTKSRKQVAPLLRGEVARL